MDLVEELALPLPPHAVMHMYADPRYAQIRGDALGAQDVRSEHEDDPEGRLVVTTTLTMPTDRVPDVARPFVGSSITVRETQRWQAPGSDGSRIGTMLLEVVGTPARVTGDMRLGPAGPDASRIDINGQLVANVPLVGRRLERAAMPYVSTVMRMEETAAQRYLDQSAD